MKSADDLFNDALDLPPASRHAFLMHACDGDPALLDEVVSLLDAYEGSNRLSVTPGHPPHIGPYAILEEIGRGGMGIVYRARDERLRRHLALKLLPPHLSRRTDWRERLEREARTLAAVHHPNIATLFSFEEADGAYFITMELVEGRSLDTAIRDGLSRADASAVTNGIAAGLEAAHARGIVHRDLKPANVTVGVDGIPRILDFGIARLLDEDPTPPGVSGLGTETTAAGTPGYMSPEQQSGRRVDHRTDIFAFGCILYECFSGQRLFPVDESPMESTVDGKVDALPRSAPRRLIKDCVTLDPDRRPPTMTDVRRRLRSSGRSRLRPALAIGVAACIAAALLWPFVDATRPIPAVTHTQATFSGVASHAEISPDGTRIAFIDGPNANRDELLVLDIGGASVRRILPMLAISHIRWMPDDRHVLVSGHRIGANRRHTLLVDAARDAPDPPVVGTFEIAGPLTPAPDGRRFASIDALGDANRIVITTLSDGRQTPVPFPGGVAGHVTDIDWSPNGAWILLTTSSDNTPSKDAWIMSLEGGQARHVLGPADMANIRWSPTGDALWYTAPNALDILRVGIDASGNVEKPIRMLSGVECSHFSLARDGRAGMARGTIRSNVSYVDLETERTTPITTGTSLHGVNRFSPDGKHVAMIRNKPQTSEVLLFSPADRSTTTLTEAADIQSLAWSPDGRSLAFHCDGPMGRVIRVLDVITGHRRDLKNVPSSGLLAWGSLTRLLAQSDDRRSYVFVDPVADATAPMPGSDGRFFQWQIAPSPDGRRVAVFETDPEGEQEPGVILIDVATGDRQPLYRGMAAPIGWSPEGRFVYVLSRGDVDSRSTAAGDDRTLVLRVETPTGVVENVATLHQRIHLWSGVDLSPDARSLVLTTTELMSDIWYVDFSAP